MLKLVPIKSEKIWGYELWIASTHENGCQDDLKNACKGNYPLLVKIIQADDKLSVQVHPDDDTARALEGKNASGKTECWYILDASDDAKIVYGLKEKVSSQQLESAIKDNTLENHLNFVDVHKGDFVYIPAGIVHAICGGIRILEVQQSCDITYRFYDWGRGREVHIEKGLKSVNQKKIGQIGNFSGAFESPYFSIEQINVKGGWSMYCSGSESKDTQLIYILSENRAVIRTSSESFGKKILPEEIYAVLPGEKITVEGSCQLLRIKAK